MPTLHRAASRLPQLLRVSLLCLLAAVPTVAASAPATEAPMRVLFIGNSLTSAHELPQMVALMAAGLGRPLVVVGFTRGNYSLEEHLADPGLDRVLARGWDLLVLQQGPSSTPDNRQHLIYHTQQMVLRAGSHAQRIAMFAPWPQDIYRRSAAAALDSYHLAAAAVDGCVLPVVSAWAHQHQRPDAATLYEPDGLHPTRDGSLLAALVIVRGLVGPARPPVEGVSDQRLRQLDASAQAAYEGRPGECIAPDAVPDRTTSNAQPAEGYWSVPGAPGSGLFLQRRGDRVAVALYGYTAINGGPSRPDWWLGTGTLQHDELNVEAFGYRDGGCIDCASAPAPVVIDPPRRLRLRFESARRGLLAIDGGADIPLTSLPFGAGYEAQPMADTADTAFGPLPLPRLSGEWMFALDAADGTRAAARMRLDAIDGEAIAYRSDAGRVDCAAAAAGRSAACTFVADDGSEPWRFALGDIEEARMQGETVVSRRRVIGFRLDDPAASPSPFDGFWFDPQRPGSGLSLQRRGPLLAAMIYDFEPSDSTTPRWRLAVGEWQHGHLDAALQVFSGGGCVGCTAPAASAMAGLPATLQFDADAARGGWLRFDGGDPRRIVALPWGAVYTDAGSADVPLPDLRGDWLFGSRASAIGPVVARLQQLSSSPLAHRFSGPVEHRAAQLHIDCPRAPAHADCVALLAGDGADVELGRFAIGDIGEQRMRGRHGSDEVVGQRLE